MVQVAQTPTERLPGSSSLARWVAAVAAVVVGVGLGALGTAMVTPGQSLAVPTAVVAGIGGAVVLVSWVVAAFRSGRQAGRIFAVAAGVVTVLAAIWTFEFALPTAIEWSDATAQAQDALSLLQHSPQNRHGTVPPQPCVVHSTGSAGPLAAPYKECAIWTPVGHLVTFIANGPNADGGSSTPTGPRRLSQTNVRAAWLATGGCSRHRRTPTATLEVATSATDSRVEDESRRGSPVRRDGVGPGVLGARGTEGDP